MYFVLEKEFKNGKKKLTLIYNGCEENLVSVIKQENRPLPCKLSDA